MTQAEQIVAQAQRWLRTPYHHAARVLGAGVDCGQLLYAVYVEGLGLCEQFQIDDYPGDWMQHRSEERFMAYLLSRCDEVSDPLPGDIALWKWGRCFSHAGVVEAWPIVIHACIRDGQVTRADATQGKFEGREVKFFRVRGEA